jgi:hypothetical protein
VDTGAVKFRVRADGCGVLDELWFGGKKVSDSVSPSTALRASPATALGASRRLNFMDAIHTDSPADYPPMSRYVRNGKDDPSRLVLTGVKLEKAGPLHAVVLLEGRYTYKLVGSTIEGTAIKGDCPFRLRIHAYAGQSLLKVEHFFYYEGDGDHDFVRSLALKVPLPPAAGSVRAGSGSDGAAIRFIDGRGATPAAGPLAGLYQQSADAFELWTSDGRAATVAARGHRFEGVLDVTVGGIGVAVGVMDFWQNAAKSLHADLKAGELGIYLWPPESPPLDFRRHAREWSVGETGEPDDKEGTTPAPFEQPNYRLASKGTGKTHYAMVYLHAPAEPAA